MTRREALTVGLASLIPPSVVTKAYTGTKLDNIPEGFDRVITIYRNGVEIPWLDQKVGDQITATFHNSYGDTQESWTVVWPPEFYVLDQTTSAGPGKQLFYRVGYYDHDRGYPRGLYVCSPITRAKGSS